MTSRVLYPHLILVSLTYSIGQSHIRDSQEVCTSESFKARCGANQVIRVTGGEYGRMRRGRCISGEGYLGCTSDVSSYLHAQCSGRRSCDVPLSHVTDKVQPCKRDYATYMEASYECIPVQAGDRMLCQTNGYILLVADTPGQLSSASYHDGFGTKDCPWTITAKQGQTIQLNLTLYHLQERVINTMCPYNIVIMETSQPIVTVPLCGYSQTPEVIYASSTNDISFYSMLPNSSRSNAEPPVFTISYKALGCPKIVAPTFSEVEHTGNDVRVKCRNTKETWYLTCKDNRWVGEIGNCSDVMPGVRHSTDPHPDTHVPLTQGLIFAVVLGVLLGVLLGFTSLAVYVVKRKRKERRLQKQRMIYEYDKKPFREPKRFFPDGPPCPHIEDPHAQRRSHLYESPNFSDIPPSFMEQPLGVHCDNDIPLHATVVGMHPEHELNRIAVK